MKDREYQTISHIWYNIRNFFNKLIRFLSQHAIKVRHTALYKL